jgi:hypothetical protein
MIKQDMNIDNEGSLIKLLPVIPANAGIQGMQLAS